MYIQKRPSDCLPMETKERQFFECPGLRGKISSQSAFDCVVNRVKR